MSARQLTTLAIVAATLTGKVASQQGPCPDGNFPGTINGNQICCPGIQVSDFSTNFEGCVIGCEQDWKPCFPFCEDPQDNIEQTTSGECTSVPRTATDYTEIVYGTATGGPVTTTTTAASPNFPGGESPSASVTPIPSMTPSVTPTTNPTDTNPEGTTGTTGLVIPTPTSGGGEEGADGEDGEDGEDGTSSEGDDPTGAAPRITSAPMLALAGGLVGLALF